MTLTGFWVLICGPKGWPFDLGFLRLVIKTVLIMQIYGMVMIMKSKLIHLATLCLPSLINNGSLLLTLSRVWMTNCSITSVLRIILAFGKRGVNVFVLTMLPQPQFWMVILATVHEFTCYYSNILKPNRWPYTWISHLPTQNPTLLTQINLPDPNRQTVSDYTPRQRFPNIQ